jgi:hypothetical protein
MRTLIRFPVFLALVLAGVIHPLSGQTLEWPTVFSMPHQSPAVDSNGVLLGIDQSLYLRSLKSEDTVTLLRNTPKYGVSQLLNYELTEDYWSNARTQFVDLSGEAVKKSLPFGLTAGLEWRPVLVYQRQSSDLGVLGSLEAGPVVRLQPLGIPVMVHAGGAARVWEDSVAGRLDISQYDNMDHDKGVYGGMELGSPSASLPHLPLILNFKGYGRSMKFSNLVAGTGYAMLYHTMANGDSLFALYADSIVDGNATLGQTGGKPRLIDDPSKTERAFQLSAGFKGSPRLFLEPSIAFSYNQHSLVYSDRQNLSSDRMSRDYTVYFLVSTVPNFPITYSGGLKIDWENQQRLNGNPYATQGIAPNLSSVQMDLDDYSAYHVSMVHDISKYFSNGMGIDYTLDISRFSREYPTSFYMRGIDTIGTNNDNDLIVSKQKLTLVPIPVSWGNSTVYYDFSRNLSNFIKQDKSGKNEIDWLYRIGAMYKNTVFGRCTLSEATSADANVTRYAFPAMNRGTPPPYSRKWTSLTVADVAMSKRIGFDAELDETYSDDGTLNSREYLDTNQLQDQNFMATYKDYYAISTKIWIHNLKVAVLLKALAKLSIDFGCDYQYNDALGYDAVANAYTRLPQAGRRVSPFTVLVYNVTKRLAGKAAVTYNFDTYLNFWDVRISLEGEF